MRRGALLSNALRANASPPSKPRAPSRALVPTCCYPKDLVVATPRQCQRRRNHTSTSPEQHRRQHDPGAATVVAAQATSTTTAAATTATTTATTTIPTAGITAGITAAAPHHDVLAPSAAAANPPPTTRPPPLHLPSKPDPAPPLFSRPGLSYLYATGVAYLKFYRTALRHVVFTNTRLLYPSSSSSSSSSSHSPPSPASPDDPQSATPGEVPGADRRPPPPLPGTRAHLHLRLRWRHDIRRLPLFALILLVCGELTPLAVLALPRAVPLACRIPRQVEGLLRTAESRRAEGRAEAARWMVAVAESSSSKSGRGEEEEEDAEVPVEVMAKVLGLTVRPWTPAFVLRPRVLRRLRFLAVDDALLIRAGGAAALVGDEVRLACADRGIDVLGRGEAELREALARWLRLTDATRLGGEGRERAVRRLLLVRDSEWQEAKREEDVA
ncbi:hypothetical protein MYCTH_2308691 [Thermothelomyces thermophilus ATCC 42464]|uniref:Letm1 RBD domain-containing protein n=1 Tax=Thermothelomyces thermophilus (strain ATCC 42464 / BCRC 31852 / DSM 1799) TaxID=573729 RepID=G2QK58_THET4|nr:uncharacterized protein MYCTH_2308691 [Thermothelomyces thermophilus ATCC 42464]AEO59964.1 hypothetical protein MYCTH_2308691 [Thermothelomyces thermophilus ATCC 42464]